MAIGDRSAIAQAKGGARFRAKNSVDDGCALLTRTADIERTSWLDVDEAVAIDKASHVGESRAFARARCRAPARESAAIAPWEAPRERSLIVV